ncbi:TPA: phage tail protein, partial [Yersinia enterocolitica]
MHRIDTPTAQVDKFGAGKNGFTRGNPQTGVPATALDDDYFDAVQEELAGVVEAAGFALNKANRAQLLAAIQKLVSEGIPDLKDATVNQKGIVQLSNSTNSTSQTLAATPKAVSDLGNLLLKITNNLSEIKDAGPAAVAQTLLNLGLGDAAKKGIASNAEMQVGTADKLVSLIGLMSIFGKRDFTENDYIRIPDVPGGLI